MEIVIYTFENEFEGVQKIGFPTFVDLPGRVDDYDNKVIIRWGRSNRLKNKKGELQEFKNVVNHRDIIKANTNKFEASQRLAACVKTPRLFVDGYVPEGVLTVYRPYRHLSEGKDFKIRRGAFKVEKDMYAVEFIENAREFRCWFVNGFVRMAERVTVNPMRLKEKWPCRSSWPYLFYKSVPTNLHDLVMKATACVGLNIGACDILMKNDEYYFVEINSAPSLDVSRLHSWFAEKIPLYVKEKFN